MNQIRRTTLLELVFAVQILVDTDDDAVAVIRELVNRERVALCGTFAGQRIRPSE